MPSGNSNIIDVSLEVRRDDPEKGAVAFWDGEKDENGREVWKWLPRSQIEYEVEGNIAEVQIPEWLALDKGLI